MVMMSEEMCWRSEKENGVFNAVDCRCLGCGWIGIQKMIRENCLNYFCGMRFTGMIRDIEGRDKGTQTVGNGCK